jgi:hypothetical protein
MCVKHGNCHIQQEMTKSIHMTCATVSDETMEVVIYRCPEFDLSE